MRWLEAKNPLRDANPIFVNFSEHDNYYGAYQCVTIDDRNVFHSP